MSIEKIITNGTRCLSNVVQKSNATQAIAAQTPILQKLDGLNALASINTYLVQKNSKPSWELSNADLEKLKDITMIDTDNNRALSYVFSHFFSTDLNASRREIFHATEGIEYILGFFTPTEDIFNSKFLSEVLKSSEDSYFKLNCIGLNPSYNRTVSPILDQRLTFYTLDKDRLSRLEEYTKEPITDAFLKSVFSTHGKRGNTFESVLEGLEKSIIPIAEFSKIKNASQFSNILAKRSYEDIYDLIKILAPIITDLNEKEARELSELLSRLLEGKTPSGNFIFGASKASDTAPKMMMSGIENILQAKKTNTSQFESLMELFDLTKKGEIPPSVLGSLAKDGKICDDFLNAVRKSGCKSEDFYNIISSNELKIDENILKKLFPEVETLAFGQGELGDCYFVSAIYDLLKNPKTRGDIFKMFSQEGADVIITIPDTKDFPIRFKNMTLQKSGKENINGPLGVQMLEEAYQKTRSLKYSTANSFSAMQGGRQADVYNAFLNTKNSRVYQLDTTDLIGTDRTKLLQDMEDAQCKLEVLKMLIVNTDSPDYFTNYKDYLKNEEYKNLAKALESMIRLYKECINSVQCKKCVDQDTILNKVISYGNNSDYLISTGTRPGEWLDKDKLIHGNHAYSIRGVDKEKGIIQLINPWNTAQYTEISFDEFKKFFDVIHLAKIQS